MIILKHRYMVKKSGDILLIEDSAKRNNELAFKLNDLDFFELRDLLYEGIILSNSMKKEGKLVQTLLVKYPHLFLEEKDKQLQEKFGIIRQYTNFFRNSFISSTHYTTYINDIERFVEENRALKVYLALDSKYGHLQEAIKQNPLFEVVDAWQCKANKDVPLDLVITEPTGYDEDISWQDRAKGILFINLDDEHIEIGPLIYTSKFKIPDLTGSKGIVEYGILPKEELLMDFFIDRILYIYAFKLHNKLSEDFCIPVRNKLIVNRHDLGGYSEAITSYPIDQAVLYSS